MPKTRTTQRKTNLLTLFIYRSLRGREKERIIAKDITDYFLHA